MNNPSPMRESPQPSRHVTDPAILQVLAKAASRANAVTVTPELAARFLANAIENNRPISVLIVDAYGKEMLEGKWKWNGEGLVFDENGRLIEGHHRCNAAVKFNVSFETTIVYGVNREEAFPTLNRGRRRTVAHVLSIDGEVSTHLLAATVAWLKKVQTGTVLAGTTSVTGAEALEILASHPGIRDSVRYADRKRAVSNMVALSVVAYLHYATRSAPVVREIFFEGFATGANLSRGNPILLLRRRLLNDAASNTKLNSVSKLALMIKAFNATARTHAFPDEATEATYLTWKNTEEFPELCLTPRSRRR